MKRSHLSLFVLSCCILVGTIIVVRFVTSRQMAHNNASIESLQSAAQTAALAQKFYSTYSSQSCIVAILAGTNLLASYDKVVGDGSELPREDIAARFYLHVRLSSLFAEAGDLKSSNEHADQSLIWFGKLNRSGMTNSHQVVEQALAHDHLIRKAPN